MCIIYQLATYPLTIVYYLVAISVHEVHSNDNCTLLQLCHLIVTHMYFFLYVLCVYIGTSWPMIFFIDRHMSLLYLHMQ